ncbi:RNA helicase [Corynebacterium qintianiae]|uniref:RNA helicase n=1 Tax=Corynebacterium qintianiae TaxID=2709392 RepID=A0A7T0KMW3_9CORY|nr:RNA helicase [Corynebacterium qintianiae]QPK83678.1 RNA helicase [Corynebacterium qintianiae]
MTEENPQSRYVPKTSKPPTAGQIAAAKLIVKRDREGKGKVKITPKIEYLANYS